MFNELFPIVETADLARALGFYRDALGGAVTHEVAGPDGSPIHVGIDVGSSHIGISLAPEAAGTRPGPVSVWVYADDCDAAVDRLREQGVVIVDDPSDRGMGHRIATALDPDGNHVVIAHRSDTPAEPDSIGASLISPDPSGYTRYEYERRFLVAPGSSWPALVESRWKGFEDIYIRHTHLRLRVLFDSLTGRDFIKLTKKLESPSPYMQMTGSIPLSPMEHDLFADLEGDRLTKKRHYHFIGRHVFSIDVFEGELEGLVLCEVEAGSLEDLMAIEPPEYALAEVTEDPFFRGGDLSRTSAEELTAKLAETSL